MTKKVFLFLLLAALLVSACAADAEDATEEVGQLEETPAVTGDGGRTLTVMTHDSFAVSEEVVTAFEEEHNAEVQFLRAGDAGSALNQAILTRGNPLADVFFGVDNTFLSRALEEGIFEPYESPQLAQVPDQFELDPEHRALPVDYGDVCLNYDRAYFEEQGLEPPDSLEDLADPAYESLTVVQNPATSSPGLAFLLTTIGHFGEDAYLDYWSSLVENDVLVVDGWETAYYTEFTRAGGSRPIVVSYASSPPAEVLFAEEPVEEAPTAAVVGNNSCFRQIEFAGILEGTENRELAEAWLDFMLSETFQEDVPLQMFVFPVNEAAELPDVFQQYAVVASDPVTLTPEAIAENREAWIQAWTETALR